MVLIIILFTTRTNMIRAFLLATICGLTACARLDNSYLPPNQNPSFNSAFASGGARASSINASGKQIPIVKFASENDGEGTYRYNYETANSITAEEQGDARGDGTKAHGSYSYTAPDGQRVSITYTADENGFVPQGSHIPTPPPIPEAILKSLQDNAAAEARGVFDDGQYRGEGLNEGQYQGDGQSSGAFGRNTGGSAGYAANGGYRY